VENPHGEYTDLEYRIATPFVGNWQTSSVFTGLTPDTDFTFQARFVEDGDFPVFVESLPSEVICTATAPLPTITFTPDNI